MAQRKQTQRKRPTGTKRKQKNEHTFLKLIGIALLAVLVVAAILAFTQKDAPLVKSIKERFTFTRTETTRATIAQTDSLEYVIIPDGMQEEIAEYAGYRVSFNPDYRTPNYVVYELTREETKGTVSRSDDFSEDRNVRNCPDESAYRHSGYDRGHMAPAADMKWSEEAMSESFYMTNMCPQAKALNRGAWKDLEEKARDWAQRDSAIVIVAGPLMDERPQRLESGVAVPDGFFKVILSPYTTPARGIAFVYKNEGGQKRMEQQAVTIDHVEEITGFDFFSTLPDDIEVQIEKNCNFNEWNN